MSAHCVICHLLLFQDVHASHCTECARRLREVRQALAETEAASREADRQRIKAVSWRAIAEFGCTTLQRLEQLGADRRARENDTIRRINAENLGEKKT